MKDSKNDELWGYEVHSQQRLCGGPNTRCPNKQSLFGQHM